MTRDEAIDLAADWWVEMFRSGRWDNGDAQTEFTHAMFKSMGYQPVDADWPVLRECVAEILRERFAEQARRYPTLEPRVELYSDYGNGAIDEKLKARGSKLNSLLHGPQKAGTLLRQLGDGSCEVTAKGGYRGEWVVLQRKERP